MTPSPTITPRVGEKMSSVEPSPSRSETEQGLAAEPRPAPASTCIETINGERPIRLSFQIKVF